MQSESKIQRRTAYRALVGVVVDIFLMHTSLVSHLAVDIALQGLLAQLNS